jgi:hypothetical protein
VTAGTLWVMESIVRVTIGEQTSEYVVEKENDDGSLLIRPKTPLEEMLERNNSRAMTRDEFDELIAPHVAPPDGEG